MFYVIRTVEGALYRVYVSCHRRNLTCAVVSVK